MDRESPLRQIFDGLLRPTLVLKPDGETIVASNDAAADLFGYPQTELQGLPMDRLRPASSDASDVENELALDSPADNPPRSVTKRVQDAHSQVFWAELDIQSISVQDRQYTLLEVKNHSEKSEREQDRRTFKTAVENAGHAIYWTDVDGTIEYANPAFEEITGYDREEVLGKTPRIFKSGAMSEEYYRDLWTTILSGETFEAEVINESADGDRIVLSQTVAPIQAPSGEIERFVAVNTDITDRKEREEKLAAEKDRVTRLQQRLSVMNRVLRHDLRSSVNIIRGNAKLADQTESQLDQTLDTIVGEADRLQRIAESIRHIQEVLEEGNNARNVVELSTRVQAKVLGFKNTHQTAQFHVDMPERALAKAREQFDLALDHLLQNAIEHTDREEPTIEVSVTKPAPDAVEIRIADDGPGIPKSELKPLEAGQETALEHTSGLGLWLAQWIVEVSGGTLSFEENDPRGTVVRIRLEAPS